MSTPAERTADCYSANERSAMQWSQIVRAILLRPFLIWLTRIKVSPDHITLLSLLAGLAFFPLFFWSKPIALVALALHVLLDGIDGPLARHQDTASPKGSFTDTMCDQIVVTTTTICLMLRPHNLIDNSAAGCFIFLYAVVIAFAMIRNVLKVPYSWLVRPRFILYAWIVIELYALPGTFTYLVWVFNTLLTLKMTSGFFMIRSRM